MDDDVRIFESSAQRWPGRNARDLLARERIEHQKGRWSVGFFEHRIAHADAIKHVKDIGAELDAKADGAERRRALEHAHRLPVTRERECGRQPAEPAADDEDRVLRPHITLTLHLFRRQPRRKSLTRRAGSRTEPPTGTQWK